MSAVRRAKWDRSKGRPEPIAALNKIIEKENGEPMVDLRRACPKLKMARPQVIPYARESVARMLNQAMKDLPNGYHFALLEGWRPYERQVRIWHFMWNCAQQAFPDRSYTQLRRTVCRWVAPIDQPAPPGHCTGAAVDIYPFNDQDELIDVVSPFTRFQAAPTYSYGLSKEAQENRTILVEAMLGAGFSNCRDEWWHYSYGDAGWAVREGKEECFYGLATIDESLYAELEIAHAASFEGRPNPWIDG